MSATICRSVRAVVFDFDGVLVQSNRIKRDGYFYAFRRIEGAEAVVRECLAALPEADRFETIERISRSIHQRLGVQAAPAIDALQRQAADAYREYCEEQVTACAEVSGASDCLRALHGRLPLYINSATWETSLRTVVRRRGWLGLFRAAYGSPSSKVENLNKVLQAEGLRPDELAFVGDRKGDWDAARRCGCRFVGVHNADNDFDRDSVTMVSCLRSLPGVLSRFGAQDHTLHGKA